MDTLAEDYAASRAWCDYKSSYAEIKPINVDPRVSAAFQKPATTDGSVRIAFFMIVHSDAAFVERLLNHLYSEKHYYLLHVDPAVADTAFGRDLQNMAAKYANVFIASDVLIVYGASTATVLLTRTMAWFDKHASGWDYMVTLTGSDYPLVPLSHMEKILAFRKPGMPFVMVWTAGTSAHIQRLSKAHPMFEEDLQLKRSIDVMNLDRGKQFGQLSMEFRSGNFGPPLTCSNRIGFVHLRNRQNISDMLDTQWLFPRDKYKKKGKAVTVENPLIAILPVDNKFRVWKKSDPAFSAAYDRESVKYIVNSEEGRKYFHFFKYMLLGSEEHYYASLLYNWERTRAFVSTLNAQSVWNTWELGLYDSVSSGFRTHTHFLSEKEWDYLEGMSRRGVFFARKFSMTRNKELIDMIDNRLLFNKSSGAGTLWPGYFEVDMTAPGRQWVQWYQRNFLKEKSTSKVSKLRERRKKQNKKT
jgi:hypothetical protein